MAKVIVSGNLAQYGNAGQFETDRSTWGFADYSFTTTRSSVQKYAGLYSCLVTKNAGSIYFFPQRFAVVSGKKYIIKAKIFVPSGTPIAAGAVNITFNTVAPVYYSIIERTDKTVTEATDNWVEIDISVLANTNANAIVILNTDAAPIDGGQMYVDQFEAYEYEDVEDPAPVCDVDLDEGTTVVNNESGSGVGDGSIDVSASSAFTLEYSKDGIAWQLASLFTGLTTGIFVMHARQQALPECTEEYPFALNFAAVTHDFTTLLTHESISGLKDGAIAFTPSGTGGPFEYSIDAGVTWQAGNNFTGVEPGTYYVAVRNAAGNSVVKVVVINAGALLIDKIVHSKNPITFSKAAAAGWDALINYRLYNDVRVEEIADSGNYVSKLKMELHPDEADQATFYLREAFRDAFEFIPPSIQQSTIARLTDRIKRYKNYSGELEDTEVTPGALDISVDNLVLYGGVNKFHFPNLNFFGSYLPTNKKFLTWAPLTKYVDRTQEDYLNYFVFGNTTTLKLQLKVYFDDATDETAIAKTFVGSTYAQLYQIPAGPVNSGALIVNAGKNPIKYELSLLDQADSLISEVRTFIIVADRHPRTRHFMFLNSLGAFEVLRFTGQSTDKTVFDRTLVQKFLAHNYAALDGEFAASNVIRTTQRSISSGYIKDKFARQWYEYLKDFMGSPIVFDVTTGARYPVVITGGDHTTEDQNYERFIRVDMRNAYDNESFTPEEI